MSQNPNDSPIVSKPSLLRPSVTITGNRELRPSIDLWVRLFALPTHPLEALMVSLQWLWASYVSLGVALVTPLVIQVTLGVIWVFLGGCLALLMAKDDIAKLDAIWVLSSVLMGVFVCLL